MAVIIPFGLTDIDFNDRAGLRPGLSSRYQCIKCITSPCRNNRSDRWANRMPWRMPVSTKPFYAWWSLPALVWLDVAGGAAGRKRRAASPAAVAKKKWKQTSQYITCHMCVWMLYSNLLGKQIVTLTGGEFLPIAPGSLSLTQFFRWRQGSQPGKCSHKHPSSSNPEETPPYKGL